MDKNNQTINDIFDSVFGPERDKRPEFLGRMLAVLAYDVQKLMKERGFTIRTLAKDANVSPTTIHRLLSAENISTKTLFSILNTLGIPENALGEAIHMMTGRAILPYTENIIEDWVVEDKETQQNYSNQLDFWTKYPADFDLSVLTSPHNKWR